MILVDTSVLIDFLKGRTNESVEKFDFVLHRKIPFGITSCILQEVLQGASSDDEYLTLKHYLEPQRFFHPRNPIESYAEAARIYFSCRKHGITIRSTIDCLLAQIAREHDLLILHNDKDFQRIADIVGLASY